MRKGAAVDMVWACATKTIKCTS